MSNESINAREDKRSPEILRADHILASLGLRPEDLRGKKILDVGSGRGYLGKAALAWGLDVVSIDKDPYLAIAVDAVVPKGIIDEEEEAEAFRAAHKVAKTKELDTPNLIVGDARQLPFADETFDLILSYAGPITINARKPAEKDMILRETIRVLKPGGEFRFGPAGSGSEIMKGASLQSATVSEGREVGYYSLTK